MLTLAALIPITLIVLESLLRRWDPHFYHLGLLHDLTVDVIVAEWLHFYLNLIVVLGDLVLDLASLQ